MKLLENTFYTILEADLSTTEIISQISQKFIAVVQAHGKTQTDRLGQSLENPLFPNPFEPSVPFPLSSAPQQLSHLRPFVTLPPLSPVSAFNPFSMLFEPGLRLVKGLGRYYCTHSTYIVNVTYNALNHECSYHSSRASQRSITNSITPTVAGVHQRAPQSGQRYNRPPC